MTHAKAYAEQVNAYNDQIKFRNAAESGFDPWENQAARFRYDPEAELSAGLRVLASHLKPQDVLIDVGGGGGRVSLAMAPRCREVINVEPSQGMGTQFEAARSEAGITNARWIQLDWVDSEGIQGDVAFTLHVTYFVADIETFIDKLRRAAGRRVIISIASTPPPNQSSRLVQLVYGEPHAPVPGHRELLPVLWDMGILPEILIPAEATRGPGAAQDTLPQTQEKAVEFALQGAWLNPADRPRAKVVIEEHFGALFSESPAGFRPLWRSLAREMLITWETSHA